MLGQADGWRFTLAYGFAHLGKSLFWYSSEILFAYFLTEFVGLPVAQMGFVIAAGFLASAAIDMALGAGLQRLLAHPRSASRLQLFGAILCSLTLALVFVGGLLPVEARFGYAVIAGVAFRIGFAVYDIPQNALMALATTDASSRLRVASTRIWFSGAATLIVAAAVGPIIATRNGPNGLYLVFGLTGVFACAAIVSAWLLSRILHRVPAKVAAVRSATGGRRRLPPEFWLLLLVMFATSAFTPAFSKLEPYFATYALRSAWWGGVVIMSMAIGIIAGQPIWMRLCEGVPRALVMLGAALLQIATLAIFWQIGIGNPIATAAAAFAFGLGNGGVGMVQWAAFSDTVARLDAARTGPSYGLFAATGKIAFALGGILLATVLDGIDFRGASGADLVPLMTAIPAAGALCCVGAALGLFVSRAKSESLSISPSRSPTK